MINKFCVYYHKTLCGEIFYVGSGSLIRAKNLELKKRKGRASKRGQAYSKFVEALNFKYTYEIVKIFDSKEDAISFEISEYDRLTKNGVNLINHKRPSRVKHIDIDHIKLFLCYDTTSESCLRWRDDIKVSGVRKPGLVAGHKMKRGCYHVKICGQSFLAHRIIMELHGFSTTGKVVDHLNGDPSDNRIENLRICSNADNARNKKKQNNNTSGVPGVSYHRGKNNWVAVLKIHEKVMERSFSAKKYGFEQAKNLAIAARLRMLEDAEQEGIFYSDRHKLPDSVV